MNSIIAIIKEKLKDPTYLIITAVLGGLILGLIIGWGVWPVRWSDTTAESMREDLRVDYLRNAVVVYTLRANPTDAQAAYANLGSKAEETLSLLSEDPGFASAEMIALFRQAVTGQSSAAIQPGQINTNTNQTGSTEPIVAGPATSTSGNSGSGLKMLGFVLLGILVVGAALVYFFFYRNKVKPVNEPLPDVGATPGSHVVPIRVGGQPGQYQSEPQPMARAMAQPVKNPEPAAPAQPLVIPFLNNKKSSNGNAEQKPLAQFMTTYMFGDDLYDESFTFDAPNGEFMGECGVSISDIIGVGEPKKISAFEVWLFDKNDVQTVTKVLMSQHVYNEPNLRQRLEMKGEPVMAEPGRQFALETATLRMEIRIIDTVYGEIPLPEKSYFQRSTLELTVVKK
ncbi:MAG: hypothetical protein WBI14_02700 [Anaerolineaceae bacterium]